MYQIGDIIVCDHNGICKVVDVREMPELKAGVLYYQLEPIYKKGTLVFAPTNSDRLVLRHPMTKEEADELIRRIQGVETMDISFEKKREEEYKETAKQYTPEGWLRMIKTIYLRKKLRKREGKKVTYIDDKYLKMAGDNLFQEIAYALDISKNQAEKMVMEALDSE